MDQYLARLAGADQTIDGRLDAGITNHQLVQGLLTGRMRDGSRFQGMAAIDAFLAGIDFRNTVALLAREGLI